MDPKSFIKDTKTLIKKMKKSCSFVEEINFYWFKVGDIDNTSLEKADFPAMFESVKVAKSEKLLQKEVKIVLLLKVRG